VPGRFEGGVVDACLALPAVLLTLVLRAPEVGPDFAGVLAFIGDFCGDLGGDPPDEDSFRA